MTNQKNHEAPKKTIKFALRTCKSEDIPNVMEINETTLPENYPPFFYEQILEKYPEAFTVAYLVDQPHKLIGYIMWRVERGPSSFGLEYVKKGHLVSLAVLDGYRRQGVANALLARSMDVVKDLGISEYVLEVRVSNAGAIRLYEQILKYEKIRILNQYYRDGEDAFYMGLRYDPTGRYKHGSTGMKDEEIYNYYVQQNMATMCYTCPKCHQFFVKSIRFSTPGSVLGGDQSMLECGFCGFPMKISDIADGKFDYNKA
jgi:ribosomal-protein-alanine N-acetyltransferase